jgi:hypothetical protein
MGGDSGSAGQSVSGPELDLPWQGYELTRSGTQAGRDGRDRLDQVGGEGCGHEGTNREIVFDRQPVWPRLMLSHYAPTVAESSSWLIMACQVGERLRQPWLDGEQSIEWWTDERTKPFMLAVATYGVLLANHGSATGSAQCLRLLLELDPNDAMGAVAQFTEASLVHQCIGSEALGRRM